MLISLTTRNCHRGKFFISTFRSEKLFTMPTPESPGNSNDLSNPTEINPDVEKTAAVVCSLNFFNEHQKQTNLFKYFEDIYF